MGRPALRKQALAYVVGHYCISQRRACKLVKMSRSTLYYLPVRDARPELRRRMKELAQTRIRYGYSGKPTYALAIAVHLNRCAAPLGQAGQPFAERSLK